MVTLNEMLFEWPFPIGQSPFHIKGQAYVNTMKTDRRLLQSKLRVDEFEESLQHNNPSLAAFFNQNFLISKSYDCYPLALHAMYMSTFLEKSFHGYVSEILRNHTEKDSSGIHYFLCKALPPHSIIKRMVLNSKSFMPFVDASIVEKHSKGASFVLQGFPKLLSPWYTLVVEGYVNKGFENAGVKSPKMSIVHGNDQNQIHGVEAVDINIRCTWQ